ncbi:MAG: type II toxin-antitoxin system VapC family toxin [Candidatus Zixiibacteriota bacterium]
MRYVADTIAIVRHLTKSKKLSKKAREIFRRTDRDEDQIIISGITLMEILYLSEKKRIKVELIDVISLIAKSENYRIQPVDAEIVLTAQKIEDIPEPHDRVIAATAKYLDIPLITHDETISESKSMVTIW